MTFGLIITDPNNHPFIKDITDDQRQQIMSIINPTDQESTFKYSDLDSVRDQKAIFSVEVKSSNRNPHYKETATLFLTRPEAEAFCKAHPSLVGEAISITALFVGVEEQHIARTLQQWDEHAYKREPIFGQANRGRKIHPNSTIFVFNMDNEVVDIRPPFQTEEYEDDLCDYTDCFDRHLITEPMNTEDTIRYALKQSDIFEELTYGYDRYYAIIHNNIILRNFPK